jgi:hypothetical protein
LNFPQCKFASGDILEPSIYQDFQPQVVLMAEITWYILDKLDAFIDLMKNDFPNTYLIHLLTTYPKEIQKHGKNKFSDLGEIMSYFKANYLEWGEISCPAMKGGKRTYFIGKW